MIYKSWRNKNWVSPNGGSEMRELYARTSVVDCSSRTNDGRRTGERSRLVAVQFRSTVARAVLYLRARTRRRAGRGRLSTERSERGPRRRRRRCRHATSPSARRDGRGEPTGRPVGRFQCAARVVGWRRSRSACCRRRRVPGAHQYTPAATCDHTLRARNPFLKIIIYILLSFLFSSLYRVTTNGGFK